jgi:nitrite reductase (NADH) small subunit
MTARWLEVCALEDIPRLGARRVRRANNIEIAIFRTSDDAVFALLDHCPHKGGPLSQGIVFGHRVACPLHNWSIELASGEAVAPDVGCVQRYGVKVESGRVFVDLASASAQPAAAVATTISP